MGVISSGNNVKRVLAENPNDSIALLSSRRQDSASGSLDTCCEVCSVVPRDGNLEGRRACYKKLESVFISFYIVVLRNVISKG